jgi:hypothetical protein
MLILYRLQRPLSNGTQLMVKEQKDQMTKQLRIFDAAEEQI